MAAQRVARPDSAGPGAPTRSLCRRGHRRGQPDVALGDGRGRPLLGRRLGPRLQPPPATESLPNSSGGADAAPALASSERGLCSDSGAQFISTPPEGPGTNGARKAQTGAPHAGRGERGPSARLPGSAPTCRSGSGAHEASAHCPWGRPGQHWAGGWTGVRRSPGKLGSLRGRVLIYLLTYFSVTVDSRCYISVGGTAWWSGICRPYRATPRSIPRPPGTVPACYIVVCVPRAVLNFPATVL